jgi:shikimate dehydrogenase
MKAENSSRALIRAGVMGWPVDHSLSPKVHGFWLRQYGIYGDYVRIPVKSEDFSAKVRSLQVDGFVGCNVTVPHKEAALVAVDELDPQAVRIGAVNTIQVRDDGTLYGFNTDGFGFLENLNHGLPGFDVTKGPVMVLGAGGAARAVVVTLLDAGAPEVRLCNRTRERAEHLAGDLNALSLNNIVVENWQDRNAALSEVALLVNTTTLGMHGQHPLVLDLDALPKDALVTDIVYTPLETDLLKRAKARGNPVVDGLGMLLHQARPGFAAWFGPLPEVSDELRAYVLAESD